jgi:outer membrane protein assembly factor BamB
VIDNQLFVSTGYGGNRARGALFQLGGNEPRQIWVNQDLETRMNSAVMFDGYGYCISERAGGQLLCFDIRDGGIIWSQSSFDRFGTLMIADGKLIILDEQGDLVIADATSAGYRERARGRVLEGRSWVMPVLANARIFAKNNLGKLVCLDVRAEPAGNVREEPSLRDADDAKP